MSTNIDEGASNDDALESCEDDEDHIETAPNNDSFLGEEIIRKINEVTRHLDKYNQTWQTIRGLEGHTERVTRSSDGSITSTVVSQVTDDELKEARERDHILFQSNNSPICRKKIVISNQDNGTYGLVQLMVMLKQSTIP